MCVCVQGGEGKGRKGSCENFIIRRGGGRREEERGGGENDTPHAAAQGKGPTSHAAACLTARVCVCAVCGVCLASCLRVSTMSVRYPFLHLQSPGAALHTHSTTHASEPGAALADTTSPPQWRENMPRPGRAQDVEGALWPVCCICLWVEVLGRPPSVGDPEIFGNGKHCTSRTQPNPSFFVC